MSRKYFRKSTAELEKLSIKNRKNPAALATVLDELKHRSRPKALQLRRRIESWLKKLSDEPTPQQISKPSEEQRPSLFEVNDPKNNGLGNDHADLRPSTDKTRSQKDGAISDDYPAAIETHRELAEKGDVQAQVLLGAMHHTGQGIPKDYGEALKWYRKAAASGHALAQNNLGVMYWKGQGIPRDSVTALKWFITAETAGSEGAKKNRISLAGSMSIAEILEAENLAKDWLRKNLPSKPG